jgi:hypothetical protein
LQQGINQVSRTTLHRMSVHATFCLHNALKAIDGKWLRSLLLISHYFTCCCCHSMQLCWVLY